MSFLANSPLLSPTALCHTASNLAKGATYPFPVSKIGAPAGTAARHAMKSNSISVAQAPRAPPPTPSARRATADSAMEKAPSFSKMANAFFDPAYTMAVPNKQSYPANFNGNDLRGSVSSAFAASKDAVNNARPGAQTARGRRPSFKIDIPAPPCAASIIRGFQHRFTPTSEFESPPMEPAHSQSGAKFAANRISHSSKGNYVIADPQDLISEEYHRVAEEYKAAKELGTGYSLNKRVSTPWSRQDKQEWLDMALSEEEASDDNLAMLRNTMENMKF